MSWLFGSDSTTNQTTENKTYNEAWNTDRRSVASDNAVSTTGDGNTISKTDLQTTTNLTSFLDSSNRSTTFTDFSNRANNSQANTNFTDNSDRSSRSSSSSSTSTENSGNSFFTDTSNRADNSNRSTNFQDASVRATTDSRNMSTWFSDSSARTNSDSRNMSTNFQDSSNRSSSTNFSSNVTDFGVLGRALSEVGSMAKMAIGSTDLLAQNAFGVLREQAQGNTLNANRAIDFATASTGSQNSTAAAILGMAQTNAQQYQASQQQQAQKSSDPTQKYMLMGGLALVAILLLKA